MIATAIFIMTQLYLPPSLEISWWWILLIILLDGCEHATKS